jgi:hypothetical protein
MTGEQRREIPVNVLCHKRLLRRDFGRSAKAAACSWSNSAGGSAVATSGGLTRGM